MKTLLLLATLTTFTVAAIAQSGQTCNTAIQNYSKDTCAYQSWVISGTEMWFYFTANSTFIYISVITTKFGINAPHVHRVELIDGTCSTPVVIADDELPFVDYWDELRIDLDASGLIPGNKYYIRLSRQPSGGKLCDKSTCRAMIQPAGFDICIQDVEVFIPPDSSLEQPSLVHEYIQNKGQIIDVNGNPRPDIIMSTANANPAVFIANNISYLVFSKRDNIPATIDTLHRVDMTLVGANPNTRTFKTEQNHGRTNYFLAHTPKGVTAKGFSRLVWNNVYPKIDMQFYSNKAGLKYYFIARQGGDAENIKIKLDGASQINITNYGGLEIVTPIGKMQFDPGHAYQINPAGNIVPMPWQAKFLKVSPNEVVFDIRKYAKNMPLIIQVDQGHPPDQLLSNGNLDWSTYYGRYNEGDWAHNICNDNAGNAYIVGTTTDQNFPVTNGTTFKGGQLDAIILKFDKYGGRNQVTYFGGGHSLYEGGNDWGFGIVFNQAVSSNHLYIVGVTSSESSKFPYLNPGGNAYFQTVNYPYQQNNQLGYDAFIVRLDTLLLTPVWATFFGGDVFEEGKSIAVDNNGNIFITGNTQTFNAGNSTTCEAPSNNGFPLCNPGGGAYYQNFNGAGANYTFDAFIAKFDSNNVLQWSTFWGSGEEDKSFEIAVNRNNNDIYIVGSTKFPYWNSVHNCTVPTSGSGQFPLCSIDTAEFIQDTAASDGNTGFLARFSSNGNLLWSSFLRNLTSLQTVTTDASGNVYVVGMQSAFFDGVLSCSPHVSTLPVCDPGMGAYVKNISSASDIFIAEFNPQNQLIWSTLYGGATDEDAPFALYAANLEKFIDAVVDYDDNLYVLGISSRGANNSPFDLYYNPNFYYQSQNIDSNKHSSDLFLVCFANYDSVIHKRIWSSLIGGNWTLDAYFGNLTRSSDFPGAISASPDKRIYITGFTFTGNFPTECPIINDPWCQLGNAYTNDAPDIFISRFDVSGNIIPFNKSLFPPAERIKVYPNPGKDAITITGYMLEINSKIHLSIYNDLGQNIFTDVKDIKKGKFSYTINVNNWINGLYLLRLNIGNKNYISKIIIGE